jgi:hypothetical protein
MEIVLLWGSPAMLAAGRGRFEWRVIVYQQGWDKTARGFGPFTAYEWRPLGSSPWQAQEAWPSYDADNGATAGLPAVTRELYDRHRRTLRDIIAENKPAAATEPTPEGLQYVMPGCEKDRTRGPAQMDLF